MKVRGRVSSKHRGPKDIPYFDHLIGPRLRPGAPMAIEKHRECGLLLNRVARATEGRRGANEGVKFVRNTLEDWAMLEHDQDELDMQSLRSLYLPTSWIDSKEPMRLDGLIDLLEWVKRILAAQYPSGSALRALLQELDRVILSISKWDGKPRGKIYRQLSGPSMVTLQQPG